jgi:hypothetical protein
MKKFFVIISLVCASFAADKKEPSIADSGTLALMVNGRKVATEHFTMKQGTAGNSVSSTLDFDDGKTKAQQQSELEVGADGSFKRYVWQEVQPGKARITAEPQDKTFIAVREKSSDTAENKETLHPLDVSTITIVDTNFYSHVEVLMWRYLAMSCANGSCKFAVQKFPIFVPYQELAQLFTLSYVGNDAIHTAGGAKQASKFRVQTENGDIDVWMDGFKMMKLKLPGAVEVVRE